MSKKLQVLFGLILTALLVTGLVIVTTATGQESSATGEWHATVDKKDQTKIELNFERRTARGSRNQTGQSYSIADLSGLSASQVLNGGDVRFSLVREAGRIDCQGSFHDGEGAGTFKFTGNLEFLSAMKSRGFDFTNDASEGDHSYLEDRLFAATTLNVTTALADDLRSAGFDKLSVNDLFKAAIFKIDSQFMREMKSSGFPNLGMEDLVKARIFKIDAEFVRQVAQMGFEKEPFESLVKMQIFKVTPQFITEVRNEGLTNLSVEEVVKLRIFKIDAEFIREAKSEGVPLEVERLVQRRLGVGRGAN